MFPIIGAWLVITDTSLFFQNVTPFPCLLAYFNGTDGCRLLTTDQKNQVRVYRAPEWTLERTIQHPHRFFQHITPIKVSQADGQVVLVDLW